MKDSVGGNKVGHSVKGLFEVGGDRKDSIFREFSSDRRRIIG